LSTAATLFKFSSCHFGAAMTASVTSRVVAAPPMSRGLTALRKSFGDGLLNAGWLN
jgi:hypothetical protein